MSDDRKVMGRLDLQELTYNLPVLHNVIRSVAAHVAGSSPRANNETQKGFTPKFPHVYPQLGWYTTALLQHSKNFVFTSSMAPGCISGLWCFRRPSYCGDDGIVSPVPAPAGTSRSNSDSLSVGMSVQDATAIETTRPRSGQPSSGNVDIPIPTPTEDSLPGSTGSLTPALIEAQPTGPHSPEGSVNIPVLAHAEEVPSASPMSGPTYCLDPAKAEEHIDRIPRFRVLVIGRANAGKTTILQRVCNTTDQPEIYDGEGQKVDATVVQGSLMRGLHDIEDELVFRGNPRFVFHDSRGFEAGSEEQFDLMKKFVMDRAKTPKLNERIHAIWYCIPLTDSHRMVTAGEKKFFDECDTGNVPVILLATKADALELEAFAKFEDEGLGVDDVVGLEELEQEILNDYMVMLKEWLGNTRFPPHDYLPLIGMQHDRAGCTSLLTCTANALKEQGLQQLLISTQQSNLELCMKFAIMKTLKKCMSKHDDKIRPTTLAFLLALWFPYTHDNLGGIVGNGFVGGLGGLLEQEEAEELLFGEEGFEGSGVMAGGGCILTMFTAMLLHLGC